MSKKTSYSFAVLAIAAFAYAAVSVPDSSLAKSENPYSLPESEGVYDVQGKPGMKLKVIVHHIKDTYAEKAVQNGKVAPADAKYSCNDSSVFDPGSDSLVSPAGWRLPSTTWEYRVNPSNVPATITAGEVYTLVDNAYKTWGNELVGKVDFKRGPDTTVVAAKADGQNIITWGKAQAGTLAVTYIWYNAGVATEIDTIMNLKYRWEWSDPLLWPANEICAYEGVYDAQGILTHELGHTVGLDDHYEDAYINNTMYGFGDTGDAKESTLTIGDKLGAWAIYGLQ